MMRFLVLILSTLILSLPVYATTPDPEAPLVNLDHLRFLTETVDAAGTSEHNPVAIVHIYSEYPEYAWVDAAGEGISAVDDVARAAIVYLWQYERTGDAALLDLARAGLNFVLYMQADDGEFYNFVYDRNLTINRTGNTSYKSLTWWAMRGLWALAEGVRVFDEVDPAYAETLAAAYLRTEAALGETVNSYGTMNTIHGFEVPAWIPGGESTVASIGLLGLSAYQRARPNETTAAILTRIADGVAAYRLGDHTTYPYGMHPARVNAPGFWHAWGAHMTHALVEAGIALDRQDWIESAAASADSFLLRQIAFERFRRIGVVPDRLNQIAYGTNQIVLTYAALYRAIGAERYARYAGLAASWYFGNNMAGVQMYDPATGRVLDGIDGPVAWRVNRNAGAESTIEGLMSMIAVADMPMARDLLHVRPVESRQPLILEAEEGQRVVGTPIYYSVNWTGEGYVSAGRYVGLGEGQRMRLPFEIAPEQAGEYWLYAAHMRQSTTQNNAIVQRADAAPAIDADDSDWPADVPVLASDTARQFLRGVGVWRGPEIDSHRVRLLWDAEMLYIYADVNDPAHVQPYTLSTVWQGDTLWFYVTSTPDARRLSAKFTFAQTPDGPQVWDWIGTGFMEGAALAFQTTESGYIYEAAVPWSSLDVELPAAGQQIGLEIGRGIGGSSFMNLTGRDPDVASNLLTVTLVDESADVTAPAPPLIYLDVRVDDGETHRLLQTISPDTDHFWLDLVAPTPIALDAGTHMLRYEYAGNSDENPGLAKVDAFYLQPVTARRMFLHPDGRMITLTYDTTTGTVTWDETK